MFGRHTAQQVFFHASALLDALCPEWKRMIVSISTDGEPKMTGHISGVATQFEQAALPGFYRIWCGLHQLDLKLCEFFEALMDEQFVSMLTALIAWLRRQQTLINEMGTKCRTLAETRWESMSKVTSWFKTNRIAILEYLNDKDPPCKPPAQWWVVLMFVEDVSSAASTTFKQLQREDTLVSHQRAGISKLQDTCKEMINARGPMTTEQILRINPALDAVSNNGLYTARLDSVENFLQNMGGFVEDRMEEAGIAMKSSIVQNVGTSLLNLIAGLDQVVAERTSRNGVSLNILPPVVPKELVLLGGSDFKNIVRAQSQRLEHRFSPVSVAMDCIETEFRELKKTYRDDEHVRKAIDDCTYATPFESAWKVTAGSFKQLEAFCGGLATTFPGTSSVESDFSILKWEKDIHRMSLTDFSLEGVMHARQFKRLQELKFD